MFYSLLQVLLILPEFPAYTAGKEQNRRGETPFHPQGNPVPSQDRNTNHLTLRNRDGINLKTT